MNTLTYQIKGDKIVVCKRGVYFSLTADESRELIRLLFAAGEKLAQENPSVAQR